MILTVTLNPSVDKTFEVPGFTPGGLNSITDTLTQPGGKGVNVAFMLRALGHEITAMGFAGNGPGRFIQNSLREAGITTAFTLLAGKTRTNYVLLDPDAGVLTKLRSCGPEVDPTDIAMLRSAYERMLGMADMVVIAGSLPPGLEPTFCAELVRLAVARGIRVALNVREDVLNAALPARPFLAQPDLRDVVDYRDFDLVDHAGLAALASHIAKSAEIAIVHSGENVVCASGSELVTVQIPACGLFGHIRLDDAMMAGAIDASMNGASLTDIAQISVAAALVAASSPNGQFASRDDVTASIGLVEVVSGA
ncbi:MAG: PfkB family carbohydrate kinase [Coriobacteriia bacterium]